MKIINVSITLLLLLILYTLVFYTWFRYEIRSKNELINSLYVENSKLKDDVALLKVEQEKASFLLQNITKTREGQLRNPTWEELKEFLILDKANEFKYDKQKFDCTGFALQLLKNARNSGFRTGFVEIEFEGESAGHVLNAFQTDKGLIFIDVTGNEDGTGKDKVAYVEVGKTYGVINLDSLKEFLVDCSVDCTYLIYGLRYVERHDLFSYDYFLSFKKCKEFHESCIKQYNQATEEYNRGYGRYSGVELNSWRNNLIKLKDEIIDENFFVVSEAGVVKNLNIYW